MDFTEIQETANGYVVDVAFTTKSGSVETHEFVLTSGGYGAFPCSVNSVESYLGGGILYMKKMLCPWLYSDWDMWLPISFSTLRLIRK